MNDDEEEYSYLPDTSQNDETITGYESNATLAGAGEGQPPESEYDFSKFKPVPDQPGPEQRQPQEPPPDNAYEFDKFKPIPDPESGPATAWRVFKQEAPGVVSGAITGGLTYGAVGARTANPLVTVGSALVGGGVGGYLGHKAADQFREDDSYQRQINEEENPWWARAGRFAANLAGFRPGSVEPIVRGVSGAISGGVEAASQAYQGQRPGESSADFYKRTGIDVTLAAAAGALFPKNWAYGTGAEKLGARLAPFGRAPVPPAPAAPGAPFPRGEFPRAPDIEVPPLPAWSGVKVPPEAPFPRGGFPRAPDIEVPPLPVTTGIKAPAAETPPSRPAMPDSAGTSKSLPPPPKPVEPTAPGERPSGGVNQIPPGGVDPTTATGVRRGAAPPAAEPPPGTARTAVLPAAEPPPGTARAAVPPAAEPPPAGRAPASPTAEPPAARSVADRIRAAYDELAGTSRTGGVVDAGPLAKRAGVTPAEFAAWMDSAPANVQHLSSTYAKEPGARRNRLVVPTGEGRPTRDFYGIRFNDRAGLPSARPVQAAATLADLRAIHDRSKVGGVSGVSIHDLIQQSGLPKEQVHALLTEAAKTGAVTLHASSLAPSRVAKNVRDAGIATDNPHLPLVTAIFKREAARPPVRTTTPEQLTTSVEGAIARRPDLQAIAREPTEAAKNPFVQRALANAQRRGDQRVREALARLPENATADDVLRAVKGAAPEALRRGEVVRGRGGRPIQTRPLPIGTERAILEAGHVRATGPRQEPRAPYREAAERGGPQDADFTRRYEATKGRTIEDEVAAFRRGEGVKSEDNPESPHYVPDPEAMGMGREPGDAYKRRILPKMPGAIEASTTAPGTLPNRIVPPKPAGAAPGPAAPAPGLVNRIAPPRPAAPAPGPAAPAPGLVNRIAPPRPAAPAPGPAAPAPGLVNRLVPPGAAGAGGGPLPVRPPAPPAGGPPPPPPPPHPPVGAPPAPPARPAIPLQQATPHDLKEGVWPAIKRWLGVNASATPSGRAARNRYMEAQGEGEHARQVAESRFTNDMHRLLNKTDPTEQRQLVNWIQGGNHFPGYTPRPEFIPVVTALRQIYRDFENYITSLPKFQQMQFWANDKYLTGQYKDPAGAQRFFSYATGSGSGGAGGKGSTMKRKFATDEDARAAGFEPISTNPIERVLRYTHAMSEYIAKQKEIDAGIRAGYIEYYGPTVVAGAGTPNPYVRGRPPQGWAKLYGVEDGGGNAAYAPREYAETFNNAHGPGLGVPQPIMDAIRKSVNTYTALELAGPAYHFLNTMHESLGSYWATALSQAVSGKFAGAAKSAVQGVLSPLAGIPRIGKHIPGVTDTNRILDVYLGRAQNVMPQERAIVDAMKAANWKPIGIQHTMDYAMLGTGSMWTSHLRGSLIPELKAELAKVTSIRSARDVGTALTVLPNMVGRVAQTIAHPLFQYYIPRMKAAAGYDNIRAWLDANPHATSDQLREASIKILKSIDNRMGEMAHDNMLMNRVARDVMALSLRSPSFSIGGVVREILAGGRSLGEGVLRRQNRISLTSPNYDPRAAYAVAFFAATGAITATYQYLKTGKMPDQDDLGNILLGVGKTGGQSPGVGNKKNVDELAIMPGYNKDFRGYWHDFTGELKNKVPGLYTTIGEQVGGQSFSHLGWKPIVPPGATIAENLKARGEHVLERLKPIMYKQAEQTPYLTSNISYPEQVMGIRAPGKWQTDPVTSAAGAAKREADAWKRFERTQNTDRALRGLPPIPPRPIPPAPKAALKAAPKAAP